MNCAPPQKLNPGVSVETRVRTIPSIRAISASTDNSTEMVRILATCLPRGNFQVLAIPLALHSKSW